MPTVWVPPRTSFGQRLLTLRASFWDGKATIQGLGLRALCYPEGIELRMSLVLLAEFDSKSRALARIDINGSRHENRHAVCGTMQFVDAGHTHFHDPLLHSHINIEDLLNHRFGDLPVARPISDMPEEFSKMMEKCGRMLHIENMTEIEEPQWQPRQFLF